MQPELDIGPLELQTFGICFAAAFLAAGVVVGRRLREQGHPIDWSYEMVFSGLIGGLVGARLDFVLENYDEVKDDLLGNVFSGAGLVWYGGVIGGAVGVLLWARFRRYPLLQVADLYAPAGALGYAIGRIGCQLSGDGDYGVKSDLPWAMSYPDGTVPTTDEVHPTPLYELLAMTAAAYVLWRLRDRFRPGGLFALYLVLAGAERFLVEIIRRNDSVVAGLTLPQLVSLAMIGAGGVWLARLRTSPARPPAQEPA